MKRLLAVRTLRRCEGCAHTVIAYNSCFMGKFRNGELEDSRVDDNTVKG